MAKLDASAAALGRKIAFHRARRGLSQREFGAIVSQSETWPGFGRRSGVLVAAKSTYH